MIGAIAAVTIESAGCEQMSSLNDNDSHSHSHNEPLEGKAVCIYGAGQAPTIESVVFDAPREGEVRIKVKSGAIKLLCSLYNKRRICLVIHRCIVATLTHGLSPPSSLVYH